MKTYNIKVGIVCCSNNEVDTEELTYAEKNEDGSVASYVTQIKYIVTSRSHYYDGIATYI